MMKPILPLAWALAASFIVGCSENNPNPAPPNADPVFPADYASTYTEVRNCRQSGDHDLNIIRVLADPTALDPYQNQNVVFPVGAVVLKEEYDFADVTCAGPILRWTVMSRLATGSSPETLDWQWQEVDSGRKVVSEDLQRCIACHSNCTAANGGFESTCALP